ncbi:hypothetical protein NQZ68_037742 [Dissostichus eleginoides]|nr:hypothetical protein NQZ68_037742 [Dissostichus eleginoides]
MDGSCNVSTIDAPSGKRYLLCLMPAQWLSLPLLSGFEATPLRDCIAVYKRNSLLKSFTYQGYICPPSPGTLSNQAFQTPPKQEGFRKKYDRLKEKIRSETEATTRFIQEDGASVKASVKQAEMAKVQDVVETKQTPPGRSVADDELKQEIEDMIKSIQEADFNPLPAEIVETLLPVPPERQTAEFLRNYDFLENPWDANPFNFSQYDLDLSAGVGLFQEDGEFLSDIDFDMC